MQQQIEALIFTAEKAITADEIRLSLQMVYQWELALEDILKQIALLQEKYRSPDFSFELREIAGGFKFFTKKDYHVLIHAFLQIKDKKKLSTAALETLSIIAYKQPVSKTEIEQIRGVNSDYSIQKLLEKELIIIQGKSEGPGRPLLYAVSLLFMDHFGLKNMKDLPKLKDLHASQNEIGMPSDM